MFDVTVMRYFVVFDPTTRMVMAMVQKLYDATELCRLRGYRFERLGLACLLPIKNGLAVPEGVEGQVVA